MTERKLTEIQNDELWVFPMDYPLRILGEAQYPLADIVTAILLRHVPDFNPATLSEKPSSGGKYVSVSTIVYVTHKDQINGMYAEFAATPEIRMVL